MSYEAWRISFQSSEQAARAAYKEVERQQALFLSANAEIQALSETLVQKQAEIERLNNALRKTENTLHQYARYENKDAMYRDIRLIGDEALKHE